MGDEEDAGPKYIYEGERAEGATIDITAGEAPKVMTKPLQLLGERSGTGKATFPQGDVYEGSYAGGLRDGQGKYSYAAPPPGEDEEPKPPLGEYDGRWVAGEKSGTGTMMYASGAKYQGSWKNGKYEGEGTLFYPNGDIYSGQWMGGKKHGDATYFFKETGAKIKGVWSYGILSSGTFTDKFGNQYAGAFSGSAEAVGFVAGGTFSMASGATEVVKAPTKAEIAAEIASFDKDGNGIIDKDELKALLCRPGTGHVAMSDEDADGILMTLTALFDNNADGKLQISEVAAALEMQVM